MEQRLAPHALAPHIMQAMVELEKRVAASGLDYSLYELVKM